MSANQNKTLSTDLRNESISSLTHIFCKKVLEKTSVKIIVISKYVAIKMLEKWSCTQGNKKKPFFKTEIINVFHEKNHISKKKK